MDEANLTVALELLDDFLTEGKAAPVWLVVGGGSALLAQRFGSRQTKDMEDLACLNASRTELEVLLRWVLQNTHETSTHPKIPTLLHELGHADLIPRFA